MSTFPMPISKEIWDMKYRLKEADGTPIDATVKDTFSRVANALAEVESEDAHELVPYYEEFMDALTDWKFCPAGRIVAGAGTDRAVTLFNCYVMGTIPDSLNGIFEMLKEAALTMQQGGGIGYDFSPLRPNGALVRGVAADASGPLSFMDVWDAMCKTIMSAGGRRGAMMATMRCDHPDIMAFIEAKKDAQRLRHFNLSVLVTDEFMEAVKHGSDWDLMFGGKVYDTIKARDLWDTIMKATYAYAEPGVIFIDRINDTNNLRYIEKIAATNPCGEQPLPPYGACLLGSINLARLVREPFQVGSSIPYRELDALVRTAIRMLDNVIDVSNFPLPQQEEEAFQKRRIGLGVTGLADALLMCGLTYGTAGAAELTDSWMRQIALSAYWASVELAREKGAFPACVPEEILKPGTTAARIAELDPALATAIREVGLRNSHLLSIAPTGTISLYSGNVSSGIEPIFDGEYERKVTQMDGSRVSQIVKDYALHVWDEMGYGLSETENGPTRELPPGYITAQELTPEAHVLMQATAQKWVDSSISKTINVPEDISFDEFKQVYELAYETGCKGCTTYRPNDVTGSILSVAEKPIEQEVEDQEILAIASAPDHHRLADRPTELDGTTYKIKMGGQDHALYVTVTDMENSDGSYTPFEIFLNTKDPTHYQWSIALTRMISAVFRRGGDVSFVAEELKAVFDPTGGAFHEGAYVPSLIAAVGGVIEKHMAKLGAMTDENVEPELPLDLDAPEDWMAREGRLAQYGPDPVVEIIDKANLCPKCFSSRFKVESGCKTCLDCGHSKCG